MKDGILAALVVIAALAISFLGTAGLVKLICWAFSLDFSWKIAIGIWAGLCLARTVFNTEK